MQYYAPILLYVFFVVFFIVAQVFAGSTAIALSRHRYFLLRTLRGLFQTSCSNFTHRRISQKATKA